MNEDKVCFNAELANASGYSSIAFEQGISQEVGQLFYGGDGLSL